MKIAFYKGTHKSYLGLFNRLIRWWFRSRFSHVELVIDYWKDNLSLCASSTGKEGVRFASILLDNDDWELVDIDHLFTVEEQTQAFQWYLDNRGDGYDYNNAFGFILRRIKQKSDKSICSESVMTALGYDNAWRFDIETIYSIMTRKKRNEIR